MADTRNRQTREISVSGDFYARLSEYARARRLTLREVVEHAVERALVREQDGVR